MMKPITVAMLAGLSSKEKASLLPDLARAMNEFFPQYEIDTELRQEHFLAQALHESDGFRTLQEYASGQAYEGRKDLGNLKKGDGRKFKGHGIFQTTGRANHARAGKLMGIDALANPQLLATPRYAVWSACIYWKDKKLNDLADANTPASFKAMTKKINGGYNGLDDRQRYLDRCRIAIVRSDATVATLRTSGSTTIAGADKVQVASLMGGGAAALSQFETASDLFSRFNFALDPFKEYFGFLIARPSLLLIPIAVVAIYYAHRVKAKRLDEHKTAKVQ